MSENFGMGEGANAVRAPEKSVADSHPSATEQPVNIEVEVGDRIELFVISNMGEIELIETMRAKFPNGADLQFFERDSEEPFQRHAQGRKHVRLIGHPCHQVTLQVRYEHDTKLHHFKPSATVFKALQWAVSEHGYNLDPMQAAKANLILPGADQPLPREDVLGKYVDPGQCTLVVDLTLKDFTNG